MRVATYHRKGRPSRRDRRHTIQNLDSNLGITYNDDGLSGCREGVDTTKLLLPVTELAEQELRRQLEGVSKDRETSRTRWKMRALRGLLVCCKDEDKDNAEAGDKDGEEHFKRGHAEVQRC